MEQLHIPVQDFVDRYAGVTEAARALGVDRVTLWRWRDADGMIPDGWAYKAKALMQRKRKPK